MMAAIPNRHHATLSLISTVIRGLMMKPSGHAGAAHKGCVQRPVERISRRSQVHRPTIGELASPLVAPGGVLSTSRVNALRAGRMRASLSLTVDPAPGSPRRAGLERLPNLAPCSGRADANATGLQPRVESVPGKTKPRWGGVSDSDNI